MKNSLLKKIKEKYNLHMSTIDYKKIIITTVIASSLVFVGYKQYEVGTRGLNVVYGEKNIGVVREEEDVEKIVSEIEKQLSKSLDKDIKIDKEITFEKTHIKDEKLSKKEEIKTAIEDDISYSAVGYAIKVNGEEVSFLDTEEDAKKALEEYKDIFIEKIDEEVCEVKSIEVLEDVSLVKRQVDISKIANVASTVETLKSGNIEEKKHTIEDKDNFWTLSEDYGVAVEEIEQANGEKDTKKLRPGDQVVIPVPTPLVTVITNEESTIEEEIKFETQYEIDDSLYEDEQEVRVEGENGRVEKTVKKERHNGIVVSEEILNETILNPAVTKVVAKGTKERPAGNATGSFITPTRGTITSPFGARWGRHHNGIDIGARIGEPVKASDSGTVKYAAFNSGGYGYLVEIDHGNGFTTLYAHNSKLYVKPGQKVNKGDVIAAVGNTGRSTGPHLHFEVRKDGSPQNPQSYIN